MKSRTTIRETLKALLNGSISLEKAKEQLRQDKGVVPTVIDLGDGTYSFGLRPHLTEAEVLKATEAKDVYKVVALAFKS